MNKASFTVASRLCGCRKRRKDKDVTSSPGGSGSPTGLGAELDSRPYLDEDFTQERIIDVDLLPLVLPPYGVDYNEWLATHSTYSPHHHQHTESINSNTHLK